MSTRLGLVSSIFIVFLSIVTSGYSLELCAKTECNNFDPSSHFNINSSCSNCTFCWDQDYSYCTYLKHEELTYCICDHRVPYQCALAGWIKKLDGDEIDYTCYNNETALLPLPPLRIVHGDKENFTLGVPSVQSLNYWRQLNLTSFDLRLFCPEAICSKAFDDFANDTFLLKEMKLYQVDDAEIKRKNLLERRVVVSWDNLLKEDVNMKDEEIGVSADYKVGYSRSYLIPFHDGKIEQHWTSESLHSNPIHVPKSRLLYQSVPKGINTGLIVLIIILVLLFIGMILACITRRHTMRHLASQKKPKKKMVHQQADTVVYSTKADGRQREEEWKLLPTAVNADRSETNSPVKTTQQKNDIMHKYVDVCRNATIIPLSQLDLLEIIGQGQYGPIKRGYIGQKNECMVHCTKMPYLATVDESKNFMEQLDSSVKANSHPNVISFLGLCDQGEDLYVAMQLETGPNLRNLLRESRSIDNFLQYAQAHGRISLMSSQRLLSIMLGVARGMYYLEDNKVLHDNLAAVNIVIGENGTPKIGGYGMATLSDLYTRQIGKNHKRLRWLPPETLTEHLFSLKSQIWSFGVVLWEIVTLGGSPYYEMSDKDVMNKVPLGIRLTKPLNCSFNMYDLMTNCWKHEAESRPNFPEILRVLQDFNLNPEEHIDLTYINDFTYEPIKQDYTEAL